MADSEEEQHCSSCKTDKPLTAFIPKGRGFGKTCIQCADKKKAKRDGKREEDKESRGSSPDEDDFGKNLGLLSLTDFLDALTEYDEILELGARVDISSISGSRRECADVLAEKIRKEMKYRFTTTKKLMNLKSFGCGGKRQLRYCKSKALFNGYLDTFFPYGEILPYWIHCIQGPPRLSLSSGAYMNLHRPTLRPTYVESA
ncbi:hypothetical protein C8F04DRAFT_1240388 [Mycena alexandri]|uniref:Uncharacterized protein n=1 Tax=Mycena alexandri TaxID=1745969 RepID=A0AAD6S8D0_9AGAR|nr:hypothetical protein C8F04DRAFT_1240388 [Mycena alexandri]